MRALGATPNDDDATVPATCVPWSHLSAVAGPGLQVPPTQSAPASTRPSKSLCAASTHESSTATVMPAPEWPATRAAGTCTWSKFQVRCGGVPAANAADATTTVPRAASTAAPLVRVDITAARYDAKGRFAASYGGVSGRGVLACAGERRAGGRGAA